MEELFDQTQDSKENFNKKVNATKPTLTQQEERAAAKDQRRKAKIPKNACFKCKGVPNFKYRNGLLCCT